MDTRKLSVIHSHPIKSGAEPVEIPSSISSKVLGVTTDPRRYWPVITIAEDVKECENKETKNRVFHFRPDGSPFEDMHRFHHIGSVFAMLFAPKMELVHVFEEMLPMAVDKIKILHPGDVVYLSRPDLRQNRLYGYMWGRTMIVKYKDRPGYINVQVGSVDEVIPDHILTREKPEGWDA